MGYSWTYEQLRILSDFGKTANGVSRLAFTKEDDIARSYILKLMCELGLKVRIDEFGNIFGRLDGCEDLPPIATGSHLDTVPDAGNFDGSSGVIAALEAVKELKKRDPLRYPLEVIVFAAEESSRFGYATMGSKVICGKLDIDKWRTIQDSNGFKLTAALEERGLNFERLYEAKCSKGDWSAFIEMHIEQGPVLYDEGVQIGIVEAIAAPTRLLVEVSGTANHSGTTPMNRRQDALVSAAHLVLAVEKIAKKEMIYGTVGTVGGIKATPGVMNVVPGSAQLLIDIRGIDYDSVSRVVSEVIEFSGKVAQEQHTEIKVEKLSSEMPVALSQKLCSVIEHVSKELGLSYRRMPSGAGHDAMNMAELTPTSMIFIPCREGVSHNGAEFASQEDVANGVKLLTEVLYSLAR